MKSLKDDLKTNTIKPFSAGCNLALHCNGKLSEMKVVGDNSPKVCNCLLYTSPSPRDLYRSRMPSSA